VKRILGSAVIFLAACAFVFGDDDNEQGGDIEGTEQLHQEIILTATTNAPPGATGKAELEAEDEDGVTSAGLQVEVHGLVPGNYTVIVTRKSDGSTVELGTFGVNSSGDNMDNNMMSEDDQGEDEEDVEIEFGTEQGLPLPDDLNPLDIAGVSINDANGHTVLTGSFMDGADTVKALFKAKVAVTGASGAAIIHTRTRHGLKTERFKLNLNGITPNAALELKINGQDFGTVVTDKHGKLRLNSLPEGIEPESITLMEFAEPDGTNAMTISF
jgi:hypothetical protein